MSGGENKTPPNKRYAHNNVQIILNICAPIKANAGLPSCTLNKSKNRASNPIDTNARANHIVRKLLRIPLTCLPVSAGITKEKTNDAAIKPRTNFGNLSHISFMEGFSWVPVAAVFLKTHQAAIKNAANPIKTFCENLTMTPALVAAGPTNSAAAVTDAVVSSVPPSHAPPTISGIPNFLITQGKMIIIGIATKRTKVVI